MPGEIDPFDYSRSNVIEHAQRAAIYAQMLADVTQMRDDGSSVHVLSRLVFEVRSASEAVKLIQGEMQRRQAEASARMPDFSESSAA